MKLVILISLFCSGCSSTVLMKCPDPAPANVFRCPDKIEGDFRLCSPPSDDYQCTAPE